VGRLNRLCSVRGGEAQAAAEAACEVAHHLRELWHRSASAGASAGLGSAGGACSGGACSAFQPRSSAAVSSSSAAGRTQLAKDRGDVLVGNAAWHNMSEVRQVRVDIQRQAVGAAGSRGWVVLYCAVFNVELGEGSGGGGRVSGEGDSCCTCGQKVGGQAGASAGRPC
jgi:hypothetical protein